MRNLKRVLSLTLASVMLLGLMVVGAGAVGYPDVDSINDNIEAIEVLGALGIFEGDDNGEFRPNEEVTRAEMAKIMAVLLDLEPERYAGSHPFTDTVGHWAENYIAACTANKVINGRGNGVYDPSATVTAIEASAMLMRAIGYFKYASDVEEGFEIATMAQANKIGIYSGIEGSAYNGMPRNDVAQLVLNALQCTMVEVTSTGTTITTTDGTVVNTGKATYGTLYATDSQATGEKDSKYGKIVKGTTNSTTGEIRFTVELGESLYDGKLELDTSKEDAFGRPAHQWKYNNKAIGTYGTKANLTYTDKVKGKDIWADLGKPDVKNGGTYYFVDNDTNSAKYKVPGTGVDKTYTVSKDGSDNVYWSNKGVLTQVYYNDETGRVDIYIINTYLAKALADYNEDDDTLSIEVKADISIDGELSGEDFAISGYKKDDYMLVTAAYDSDESNYVVQSVNPATVVSGVTISEYKKGSNVTTSDNKKYDYAYVLTNDTKSLGNNIATSATGYDFDDVEYNLYLDQYGYVIGVEKATGGTNLSDYLFVKEIAKNGFIYQAKVVFMDGTSETVTVSKVAKKDGKLEDTKNVASVLTGGADTDNGILTGSCFYTYKVDKNGEYQLTSVGANGTAQGTTKSTDDVYYGISSDAKNSLYPFYYQYAAKTDNGIENILGKKIPVANSTVFIAKESVYVGLKNAPDVYANEKDACIYYMLDKDAKYIAAVYTSFEGTASTAADEWFYIYDNGGKSSGYVSYSAVQGATKTTLKVDNTENDLTVPGLYKIKSYTSEGYAKLGDKFIAGTDTGSNLVYVSPDADAENITWVDGALGIGGYVYYTLTDDAQIYRINANEQGKSVSSSVAISASSVSSLSGGTDVKYDIYLVMDEKDSGQVAIAYFVKKSK